MLLTRVSGEGWLRNFRSPRISTCYTAEERREAWKHPSRPAWCTASMVDSCRALFYRVEARFAGWASCWWIRCGPRNTRVVARSRRDGRREGCLQDGGQKRWERKGEGKGVFRRVTVDHVRWTRLGCLRSRNRAEEDENLFVTIPRQSFLSATLDATILIDIFNFHSATRSLLVFDFCRFVERREEIITKDRCS